MRFQPLVTGLVLIVANFAQPVWAAEPLKVELKTTTAQIAPGVAGSESVEILVSLSGNQAAHLTIAPIDIVLDEKGKSLMPAGSTNYSIENQVNFEPAFYNYRPNGSPQQFVFAVTAADKALAEVRFGGLQVVAEPLVNRGASASGNLAAITTFAIVPAGLDFDLPTNQISSVLVSDLQLVQAKRQSLADWLFPDWPGLVNSGPVVLTGHVKNQNVLPVFSQQSLTWSSDGQDLVTSTLPQRLLLAEQQIEVAGTSTTKIAGSNISYNFAEPFQKLTVSVTEQSFLGNRTLAAQTLNVSVLVIPWKEFLLVGLLGAALVLLLIRIRKGKSRPKQKSKREPTTLWLFLVWVYKNLKRRLIHRQ